METQAYLYFLVFFFLVSWLYKNKGEKTTKKMFKPEVGFNQPSLKRLISRWQEGLKKNESGKSSPSNLMPCPVPKASLSTAK